MFSRLFSEVKTVASSVSTTVKTAAANVRETVKTNIQTKSNHKTVHEIVTQISNDLNTNHSLQEWLELLEDWQQQIEKSDKENAELYQEQISDNEPEELYTFKQIFLRLKVPEQILSKLSSTASLKSLFQQSTGPSDLNNKPWNTLHSLLTLVSLPHFHEDIHNLLLHILSTDTSYESSLEASKLLSLLLIDHIDDHLRTQRNRLQQKAEKVKVDARNPDLGDVETSSLIKDLLSHYSAIALSLEQSKERRERLSSLSAERLEAAVSSLDKKRVTLSEEGEACSRRAAQLEEEMKSCSQERDQEISKLEEELRGICERVEQAEKVRDDLKIQLERANQHVRELQEEQKTLLAKIGGVREEKVLGKASLTGNLSSETTMRNLTEAEIRSASKLLSLLTVIQNSILVKWSSYSKEMQKKRDDWGVYFVSAVSTYLERELERWSTEQKKFSNEMRTFAELIKEARGHASREKREDFYAIFSADGLERLLESIVLEGRAEKKESLGEICGYCGQERIVRNIHDILVSLSRTLSSIDAHEEKIAAFLKERENEIDILCNQTGTDVRAKLRDMAEAFRRQHALVVGPLRDYLQTQVHTSSQRASRVASDSLTHNGVGEGKGFNMEDTQKKINNFLSGIPKTWTSIMQTEGKGSGGSQVGEERRKEGVRVETRRREEEKKGDTGVNEPRGVSYVSIATPDALKPRTDEPFKETYHHKLNTESEDMHHLGEIGDIERLENEDDDAWFYHKREEHQSDRSAPVEVSQRENEKNLFSFLGEEDNNTTDALRLNTAQEEKERERLDEEKRLREQRERENALREQREKEERQKFEKMEREKKEKEELLKKELNEKKVKEESERRHKEEIERMREEREKKVREEHEKKAREELERKAKEEHERKAKEELERKAKEEQERKAREELELKRREQQEKIIKEEQEKKAREEQEKKAREEQERKAREEQVRKAREEQERKAKEENEKKAQAEMEKRSHEEAERKSREVAELRAKEEEAQRLKEEKEKQRQQNLVKEQEAKKLEEKEQNQFDVNYPMTSLDDVSFSPEADYAANDDLFKDLDNSFSWPNEAKNPAVSSSQDSAIEDFFSMMKEPSSSAKAAPSATQQTTQAQAAKPKYSFDDFLMDADD